MQSFTMGTSEMVNAMVESLPDVYTVSFNKGDMEALVRVLSTVAGFTSLEDMTEEMRDKATSLFSSIAETLHIEGI
jgi:hypothetical protein